MRSCFPWAGRSARVVLEPPSASKERNYFNELNKDPYSLIKEVKTHLNMGSFDEADTKYMDVSSGEKANYLDAVASHSPLAKEEESAHAASDYAPILQLNGYREEELDDVSANACKHVSANACKHGTLCGAEKREDGGNFITGMNTANKEIMCSKEEKKENMISTSLENDFIDVEELDTKEIADKEKLSTKVNVSTPAMHVENSVIKSTEFLLDRFVEEKELSTKAIPDGVRVCVTCDTDNHENPESEYLKNNLSKGANRTQDGKKKQGAIHIFGHKDYNKYYNKGKVKPSALYSYGISDQQRDFLFLCAGLVIQAVGFQLRSLVEIVTALILLCYRAYIFVCRFADTLSNTKQKLAEAHALIFSYVAVDRERIALHKERWESMKPLIIQGAKKMGWGCLNAAYVLAVLSALLLTSFLFSYLAVKGGTTQKPIHIKQELFFDYTQAHPVASLDLFSLDAYRKMSNATKGIKVNPGTGVWYYCTVLLTLPESDHNRKLGVFQVRSEVLSEKGEIMAKGSQPCMLVFRSSILHYIKSIVMAIPVLTGLASEAQTLTLQLLEWYQDLHESSTRASARMLQIELVPRAGVTTSAGLPHLYNAHLLIDSLRVIGPRSLSIFASSGFLGTLFMWILLSFLIFCCLSIFCMYRMHHKSEPKEVGKLD